jgi:hypothetical protein
MSTTTHRPAADLSDIDVDRYFGDDMWWPGGDPDSQSETLASYHQLLWGKPLPDGTPFPLVRVLESTRWTLRHDSRLGEFVLTSDSLLNGYHNPHKPWTHKPVKHITEQLTDGEHDRWWHKAYTIGAMGVWPGQMRRSLACPPPPAHPDVPTINQARGTAPEIRDRFDLTMECVRRHYSDEPSPLSGTFTAYADWFACSVTSPGTSSTSCCRISSPRTARSGSGCRSTASAPARTHRTLRRCASSASTHSFSSTRAKSGSLHTWADPARGVSLRRPPSTPARSSACYSTSSTAKLRNA